MSKKCTPLWREAHFEVKSAKNWSIRSTFGRSDVVLRGRGKGLCIWLKVTKTWGFCSTPKRWQAWDIWRGSAKMHCPWQAQYKRHAHQSCWEVRALISWEGLHFGASNLQVCWDDFAWQVQHFVWPGITFSWQAQYFRQVEWKNRKTHWYEAVSSALNFPCSKEVSQNCFVFYVVHFQKWRSLAKLFRFWCCQVEKLRRSCGIAAFLMSSSSKTEDVSQNSFVFKLADRQIDRETTTTAGTITLHYYYNYKCKYITLHYTTLITLPYTKYI